MLDGYLDNTPLSPNKQYSNVNCENLIFDEINFMKIVPNYNGVGSFQYLVTMTRWNIIFPINP